MRGGVQRRTTRALRVDSASKRSNGGEIFRKTAPLRGAATRRQKLSIGE